VAKASAKSAPTLGDREPPACSAAIRTTDTVPKNALMPAQSGALLHW